MRLLVAEDNQELADLLERGLARHGFFCDLVDSVEGALSALVTTRYSAVVLDLGLRDGDGLSVVEAMRDRNDSCPVLILTARGSIADRVHGLGKGADDYLTKPFALEELVARLRALLRRPGDLVSRRLELANLAIDTESKESFVQDARLGLSPRELGVLEMLLRRSGRVVPKRLIEDQLFGLSEVGPTALEVHIHRLRKRLVEAGAQVQIQTIRGVGYLIIENGS